MSWCVCYLVGCVLHDSASTGTLAGHQPLAVTGVSAFGLLSCKIAAAELVFCFVLGDLAPTCHIESCVSGV